MDDTQHTIDITVLKTQLSGIIESIGELKGTLKEFIAMNSQSHTDIVKAVDERMRQKADIWSEQAWKWMIGLMSVMVFGAVLSQVIVANK